MARAPASRSTSLRASVEPLVLEGTLYRESFSVPGIVKEVRAAIYPDCFGIFGSAKPRASNKLRPKKFSQTWRFTSGTAVGKLEHRTFSIVSHSRRNKLLALLTNNYTERQLWAFTLTTKTADRKSRSSKHISSITLAFPNEHVAQEWIRALEGALLAHRKTPTHSSSESSEIAGSVFSDETPRVSNADSGLDDTGRSNLHSTKPRPRLYALHEQGSHMSGSSAESHTRGESPGAHSGHELSDGPQAVVSPFQRSWTVADRSDSFTPADRELIHDLGQQGLQGRHEPATAASAWEAFHCANGITACVGRAGDNRSAIMLSYIVRAPPQLVTRTLLQNQQQVCMDALGVSRPEHLETVDPFTQYFRSVHVPKGLSRFLVAPREAVFKRSWRKEDDGTYVVLYSSCSHRDAPLQFHPWWRWFAPVRALLESTGWTMAPLLPSYVVDSKRDSSETLVTMVIKLDAQGWLSRSNPLTKLFDPFLSLFHLRWRSFAHPLIQHAEVLRTQAEAERFVMRPFLQGHEHSAADPEPGSATHAGSQPPPPPSRHSLATLRTKSILRPMEASSFQRTRTAGVSELTTSPPEGSESPMLAPDQQLPTVVDQDTFEDVIDDGPPPCGTCPPEYWSCPGAAGFKVRGERYLRDHVKVLSEDPLFALASVDLLELDEPCPNIARFLPSVRDSQAPFTFVVQIMIPGNPLLSLSFAWAAQPDQDPMSPSADPHLDACPTSPFDMSLARFLAGGESAEADARRNATFKLIPRVTEGSWIIKQSVGTTPCLLGRKLRTLYHRGEGYMEVDVDVASSSVAATVVGMVSGATKALVVDMGVVLEGHTADELPERLLGTVRFSNLDMTTGWRLNTKTGELSPRTPKGQKRPSRASKGFSKASRVSQDSGVANLVANASQGKAKAA